jgi:hypothetical protein
MATMLGSAPLTRRRLWAVLFATVSFAATVHGQSAGDMPPARVTSDTAEFCTRLAQQLRAEIRARSTPAVPDEVFMLQQEGRKMCREGHIRPGILRIRQALMILRQQ